MKADYVSPSKPMTSQPSVVFWLFFLEAGEAGKILILYFRKGRKIRTARALHLTV